MSTYTGEILKVDNVLRNDDFVVENEPLILFAGTVTLVVLT